MFFHAFIDVISGQLKAEKRKLSNTGLEGAKLDEPPRGNSGGGSLGGLGRGGDGQSAGSSDVERSKPGGSRQQKRSCQHNWQVRS